MKRYVTILLLLLSITFNINQSIKLYEYKNKQTFRYITKEERIMREFYDGALNDIIILARDVSAGVSRHAYYVIDSVIAKRKAAERRKLARAMTRTYSVGRGTGHKFYAGNCTRFVADRVNVTWTGNAGEWIDNAKAVGAEVDDVPEVGDIIQTNEGSVGHVALVTDVRDGKVIIEEMNYKGLYIESTREIDIDSPKIDGYITPPNEHTT